MRQLSLLAEDDQPSVVNVASVPQRSPFRYPGGKTWFVPFFRQWIKQLPRKPASLVEPFCGGAIIGLTALLENLADQVVLCERDPHVSSVWRAISDDDPQGLAQRIVDYQLTKEAVVEDLGREPTSLLDHAFQTLLRNRVQRGGIMARGRA